MPNRKQMLSHELMPTVEVAAFHQVSVATVNRWAKGGRLPVAVKVPGKRGANLFRRSDVEALLAKGAA